MGATNRWLGLISGGMVVLASGAGAVLPPNSYIPPAPWEMSVGTEHRGGGPYELPPPRQGLVVEGFDYSDEGGLPWRSSEVEKAVRANCPGGDTAFELPDGAMLREGRSQAQIRPFVLVATEQEALLLRRYPQIIGSDGCKLSVRYRLSVDRAFVSGGTVTTLFGIVAGAPDMIRSDRPEEGRNGLLDNLLLPVAQMGEVLYHQPRGGTAKMRAPIPGVPAVCFDMSPVSGKAHECYLDDKGPWFGLTLEIHSAGPAGRLAGTQVTDIRQGVPIEGRLFEWDRPITLRQ